jgi:hypothetical protein
MVGKYYNNLGVTIDRVWIGEWIYWPLMHTTRNCKYLQRYRSSPQHPLGPFPACCIISGSLAGASGSGDSSASRARDLSSQPLVQNSALCQLDWVASIVGMGHIEGTVSNGSSIVVEACSPRRCIATAVVSFVWSPLPSNWSIRHNMKEVRLLEVLGVRGRIILKWILRKKGRNVSAAFI